MSHGDLKTFFGVEISGHRRDKYAKNEQRRLKYQAWRQEQRRPENFFVIEIAPKISQITGLYCSKIRTFTQGPGARCMGRSDLSLRAQFRKLWEISFLQRLIFLLTDCIWSHSPHFRQPKQGQNNPAATFRQKDVWSPMHIDHLTFYGLSLIVSE